MKEHHSMDKERLILIVRNLELLVDGLKAEVYSDVDAYKKEMNYDEVARYVHDYDEVFEDLPVTIQKVPEGLNHNYHKYTVRFEDKETRKFIKDMIKSELGFSPSIHYEKAISDNSMFKLDKWRSESVNAPLVADTILSLPIHAWLKDEEVEKIANTIALRSGL